MSDQIEEPITRSILLIDGGRAEAELMQAQFRRGNVAAKLHFVADGEEAIEFLLKKDRYEDAPRPVLIFLDMRLANGGGFEMLTMAKTDRNLARIPIIVLSASPDGDVKKAYSLQANCCVNRPTSPEELTQFVKFIKVFWLEVMTLPN
jgi:chemotaxis family two-component system response regulator Rcp1